MVSMPSPAAWAVIDTMPAKAELNAVDVRLALPMPSGIGFTDHIPAKLLLKTSITRGR
jgi:hypothetical protein